MAAIRSCWNAPAMSSRRFSVSRRRQRLCSARTLPRWVLEVKMNVPIRILSHVTLPQQPNSIIHAAKGFSHMRGNTHSECPYPYLLHSLPSFTINMFTIILHENLFFAVIHCPFTCIRSFASNLWAPRKVVCNLLSFLPRIRNFCLVWNSVK